MKKHTARIMALKTEKAMDFYAIIPLSVRLISPTARVSFSPRRQGLGLLL